MGPSVTPLGIDPENLRLAAQCLNHYATAVPCVTVLFTILYIEEVWKSDGQRCRDVLVWKLVRQFKTFSTVWGTHSHVHAKNHESQFHTPGDWSPTDWCERRSKRNCLYATWYKYIVGRDSSVGIATRYRLHGPGIESRNGCDFPHPSWSAVEPTQPPSSAEVKGIVELYLYSPSGPSWPVLGHTLLLQAQFGNQIL
jgi:hypothetical protein